MQRIVNLNFISFLLCLSLNLCVGFELLIVKQNLGSFFILIIVDLDNLYIYSLKGIKPVAHYPNSHKLYNWGHIT